MLVSGAVMGGLWGAIPAWFKTRFGTNETLFTLMMNYVAQYFIQFLREGPWRDPTAMGFPIMPRFEKAARLPKLLGIHMGWVVALALVALVFFYLRYTKHGYELTVVGENENTARYAGMPVKRIILRTMFLSAAICGLAGVMQASGADMQLTDSVAGGVGFTASSCMAGAAVPAGDSADQRALRRFGKGSGTIESTFKISPSMADVLQGTFSSLCWAPNSSSTTGSCSAAMRRKEASRHDRRIGLDQQFSLRRHTGRGAAAVWHAGRDSHRKGRQREPGCGRHDVHGRCVRLHGRLLPG
jgi:ABC-type uncharacterized transport system permease subunit